MPLQSTIAKARKDKKQGKSPSTQAGEFVRQEVKNIRKGKHGARSAKQAIAIGLSEARRAGVAVKPKPGVKKAAKKATVKRAGIRTPKKVSAKRSRAITKVLKREPTSSVSPENMAKQARTSARQRGPTKRQEAALKAAQTRNKTMALQHVH